MSRRRGALRLASAVSALLGAALLARASRADATEGDGAYGRLAGDLELRAGVGGAAAAGGPALAVSLGATYLSTAGAYAVYTDALGGDAALAARSFGTGIHVRPLFLARYASDLEQGPARLDLTLDSFALEVGCFWHVPRAGELAPEPGLEVAVSSFVPVAAGASGPFVGLRGALRWRAIDLAGAAPNTDAIDRGAFVALTIAWHHVVMTHLVDFRDRRPR